MRFFVMLIFCGLVFSSKAQSTLAPRNLQVTVNKTTNLIFPSAISSIDRGSERIVVQKSTGNILRVKADTVFTDTTNLTVITADGKLYSFLVGYAASPDVLNINLGAASSNRDTVLLALAEKILPLKNNLYGIRYSSGKVRLSVAGIYTTGQSIIFKLRIENSSTLSFEMGRLRCHVSGSNSSTRRPVQQVEVTPLFIHPVVVNVKPKQYLLLALILPKAALGTGQELQLGIAEKDGERQLSLRIPNRFLLNANLIQ